MLANIKQTVRHTAYYGLGNLAPKLIGFVLLPLYTKLITVADYGILGLLELVGLLSVHVLSMGMPHALLRWRGLANTERQRRQQTFSALVFLAAGVGTTLAIILPLRNSLADFLFHQPMGSYIILLALFVTFSVLNKVPLTIMRSEEKSTAYAMTIAAQFTVNLLANIYFVAIAKLGIEGILISQAISSAAVFFILLPYLGRRIHFSLDLSELKQMVRFGGPLIFAALAISVLNWGDRYILSELATFKEVGLYTLGYKFSNVMKMLLVDAFALGLPTIGWRIVKEETNPQRFFSKTLTYLAFSLLWCGLALSIYGKGIIHLLALDKTYWGADVVVPVLVLSIVFAGMQTVLFFLLQIPRKTQYIAFIIGGAAAVNVGLNLLWIPRMGIMGAAWATLVTQVGSLFLSYRTVQRVYPVRYELKRIGILFTVALALFAVSTLFNHYLIWQRVLFKALLLLSFPVILYLAKFYDPVELNRMKGSAQKWRRKLGFH